MFLRLPRHRTDARTARQPRTSGRKEVLQLALDGDIPGDEQIERFLDHCEKMP